MIYIISDLLTSVRAIQNRYSTNPIDQRIRIFVESLTHKAAWVERVWIPSRRSMIAQDAADSIANTNNTLRKNYSIFPSASSTLETILTRIVHVINSKLLWTILPNRKISDHSSRVEIIITHLRIGHQPDSFLSPSTTLSSWLPELSHKTLTLTQLKHKAIN